MALLNLEFLLSIQVCLTNLSRLMFYFIKFFSFFLLQIILGDSGLGHLQYLNERISDT